MKKILCIILFMAACFLGYSRGDAADAVQTARHDWEGTINGKIPVAVWMEIRDGIIAGEIVYTATKAKKPIRLLGRVRDDGRLQAHEMLPTGIISGTLLGTIRDGSFAGTWSAGDTITRKGGRFSSSGGKQYPLSLKSRSPLTAPFLWDFNPGDFAGTYAYSFGEYGSGGTITLRSRGNGEAAYRIESNTSAPHFNMAVIPENADAGMKKGQLQGNRILYKNEDGTCSFELLLFNGFAVVRYTDGSLCRGCFGLGATVEGMFQRTQ